MCGYTDSDDKYQFILVDFNSNPDEFHEYDYDDSTTSFTDGGNNSNITISDSNESFYQYWLQNGNKYILERDHLWMYDGKKEEWSSYTGSSVFTGVIWNNTSGNLYEINYFIFDEYLIKVFDSGGLLRVKKVTSDPRCGYDDFYLDSDNSKIFQETKSTLSDVSVVNINTRQYQAPTLEYITQTEPSTNEGLVLYDDDDTLLGYWFIRNYTATTTEYTLGTESVIKQDLNETVNSSYSSKTAKQIIQDIIDNYCSFLKYSSSIDNDDSQTATYTISFKNSTVADVFKWADSQEGQFTAIRPDCTVYWDEMDTEGAYSIDDTSEKILGGSNQPSKIVKSLKYSKIVLTGAWDDANEERYESVGFGEPNYGIYRDEYPALNQTQLDAMLTNIQSQKNQTINFIRLAVYDEGMYNYGRTVTLNMTLNLTDTGTHYLYRTEYDAIRDICWVQMSSALYVSESDSLTQDKLLNDLSEKVDQANTDKLSTTAQKDLDMNNKNIDDVASIDGGGNAIDVNDDLDMNGKDIDNVGGIKGFLKIYSDEAGKTDWRFIINTTDADNISLYAYDEGLVSYEDFWLGSDAGGVKILASGGIDLNSNLMRNVFKDNANYDDITIVAEDPGDTVRRLGIEFSDNEGDIGRIRVFKTSDGADSTMELDNFQELRCPAVRDKAVTGYNVEVNANDTVGRDSSTILHKENIRAIPYGLEAIMNLNPVQFDYNTKYVDGHLPVDKVGLIAEEVAEVIPEIVYYNTKDFSFKIEGFDHKQVIPVLVKGMQEQQAQIEDLHSQIEDQQDQIEALKLKLNELIEIHNKVNDLNYNKVNNNK